MSAPALRAAAVRWPELVAGIRSRLWWIWGALLLALLVVAVAGDRFASQELLGQAPTDRLLPPLSRTATGLHVLGTDELGRDLLSRIIVAARLTVFIALSASVIGLVVGVTVGMCAGYFGGWIDRVGMRLTEMQTALPMFLFVIMLMTVTGPSVTNLVVLLPTFVWPTIARVVRVETQQLRAAPFVIGAVALGAGNRQVLLGHILPNLAPRLAVLFVIEIGQVVLAEAGLSFLGAGIQDPDLTWGLLIASGRDFLAVAWWLTIMPGVFLACGVFAVNMLSRTFERRSQA
ncbi:ABC transporter permease [Streptomyces sp. NPDC058280]|uniref:ABC transporter permease n=1 Tax=Streptomyces sp. NPDC058280 TaxID=3346419 RepID=UPI0036E2D65E